MKGSVLFGALALPNMKADFEQRLKVAPCQGFNINLTSFLATFSLRHPSHLNYTYLITACVACTCVFTTTFYLVFNAATPLCCATFSVLDFI